MEANQDKLNVNLGSKRKEKKARSSDQTSDDDNKLGLSARDGSAERDLISTENKTQNSNESYALNARKITNESIGFEFTTTKTEDDDNLAEINLHRNVKESREIGLFYSRIESKTESIKDESSKKFTEDEKKIEKEEDTRVTNREGQASLTVEDQKLETIDAVDENSLEERDNETRAPTAEGAEKESKQDDLGINPNVLSENCVDDSEIADADEDKVAVEQNSDEYVYRILRFNEAYHNGLRPKKLSSRISLQQHVERGSKGQKSSYISCCKTLTGIERLGGLTKKEHRRRDVVKINITKLSDSAEVIDLTREEIRERHISLHSKAWEYAEKFEEVIIKPTSHVPSEYVEKIGVVHMKSFSLI